MEQLEREPADTQALALMSRLCLLAEDVSAAIAYAGMAVRADRDNSRARAALDAALAQRSDPKQALERLFQAVELEPDLHAYYVCYGSAPPFPNTAELKDILEQALRGDPGLAAAHAARANVLARNNETLLAIPAYRRALDIDPRQPEAALALSELLFDVGDTALSEHYRTQAFAQKQFYAAAPRSRQVRPSVLVLNAPAAWAQNTPLEFTIDPSAAALHRLYLTGDPLPELPAFDVVFNAIGEAERAHDAIERAKQFIARSSKRVINHPKSLWKTARPHLAAALSSVPHCTAVQTQRVARDKIEVLSYPVLIRPIDTHAGRGLERIDDTRALGTYLERHAGERFDVAPFVNYRSSDGFYRKYRVMLVDGKPYPYHLAISPEWMVHYIKTPTAGIDWMRAEEERFLRDPASVFANWDRTFSGIAQAIGLDYFGVDCTLLADGHVLVFEADAAMLVHCREPADSYKHQYVSRIFRAAEALLIGL